MEGRSEPIGLAHFGQQRKRHPREPTEPGTVIPARPHHRIAFTLVEILVVVAIIALLVAILLPSLNKAKELARMTKCLSNMSQIGKAMGMYQSGHRGWLPVGPADRTRYVDRTRVPPVYYDEPGPGRVPYPYYTCHWGGKRAAVIHHWKSGQPPEILPRPLTEFLYRGSSLDSPTPLFECPSDNGSPEWKPLGPQDPYYYTCGNSYWINPWTDYPQISSKRLRAVSSIVVVEEAPMYFALRDKKNNMGWHKKFSQHNLLFLDFHAEPKKVDTRKYYGPGWFVVKYFEIMDYYRF